MTPDELRAENERLQARLEEIRKICAAAIGAEGRSIELAYKIRRVLQTTGHRRMTNRPQRQDALFDQLRDLIVLANEHGMYDAADAVQRLIDRPRAEERPHAHRPGAAR
jgi:hypothetical protein